MNPIIIWRIVATVGTMFGIGGIVYGADQHRKRKIEQTGNHVRLKQVEAEFTSMEQQWALTQALLGYKNEQVRILANEVDTLRKKVKCLMDWA